MVSADPPAKPGTDGPRHGSLGMWDVVSLMVGIVVGVSIFRVPGRVFDCAGGPWAGLLVWIAGAVLALSGALCYAELSAAYPRFGAEYVFLGRAYSRRLAFLFGWMQTFAVIPGSVGAMAFVFASYAMSIWPGMLHAGIVASGAVIFLTILQLSGFEVGRVAQNVMTLLKVASLTAVLICGLLLAPDPVAAASTSYAASTDWSSIGLALVFVLYAYGGWNDVAAVTPEVRDCQRNVPRALTLGLLLIAVLYLLLNLCFLRGLGYAGVTSTQAPAAEIIRRTIGPASSVVMSLIVMASALGSMHATIFSGCRMLSAIGEDFPLFRCWSYWSGRQVPIPALLTITGMSLLLTAVVGMDAGHRMLDALMRSCSLPTLSWDRFEDGFELLVTASAPIFWAFFFLSGLSLIILRFKDRNLHRPYRVPLYPLPPILFSAAAAYMFWSSAQYAGKLMFTMLPLLLAGITLAIGQRQRSAPAEK